MNKRHLICYCALSGALLLNACGRLPSQEPPSAQHPPAGYQTHQQRSATPVRGAIIRKAYDLIGVRYRYGGTNPQAGFDCSGLIYYIHHHAGIRVPRTTGSLLRASRRVDKRQLKAGDLVFFRLSGRKVSHVGLYVGDGEFIHAPSRGKRVHISNIHDPYWRKRWVSGGRLL